MRYGWVSLPVRRPLRYGNQYGMQWPCLDMFVVRLRLLTMFDAVWLGVLACKAAHAVWKYGLP